MGKAVEEIINVLRAHEQPIPISVLLQSLNDSVSERTLRRWLKKLVEQGQVKASGRLKSTVYSLGEQHPFFSHSALALLSKVNRPIYQREPCTYNEQWLAAYEPNQTYYLTQQQRTTLSKLNASFLEKQPASTYVERIFNRLLVDLSYNSSRLEGNTYTLLETEKLVLTGQASDDKLDAEKIMIINHKEAIKFLINGINRIETNIENIRTIHYLLSEGLVLSKDAGQIREEVIRVSGTTYIPLESQEQLTILLTRVCQKASRIQDPFEQSFFLLLHVSYLQAFIDVNKRTARLAANITLVRHNLIPVSFNDITKKDYITALIAIYECNDATALAELYVWSYVRSCKYYKATAAAMGIDILSVRYRPLRRKMMTEIINTLVVGDDIASFVNQHALASVPKEDRDKFVQEMLKELAHLEVFKLAGLGVSVQQFEAWRRACVEKK
jgi:DNA-binding transcriptional ArsR family regulator